MLKSLNDLCIKNKKLLKQYGELKLDRCLKHIEMIRLRREKTRFKQRVKVEHLKNEYLGKVKTCKLTLRNLRLTSQHLASCRKDMVQKKI